MIVTPKEGRLLPTGLLAFSDATSTSSRIHFTVSANGIINFGTGGTTCENFAYTNNTQFLRNLGADGNAVIKN